MRHAASPQVGCEPKRLKEKSAPEPKRSEGASRVRQGTRRHQEGLARDRRKLATLNVLGGTRAES